MGSLSDLTHLKATLAMASKGCLIITFKTLSYLLTHSSYPVLFLGLDLINEFPER